VSSYNKSIDYISLFGSPARINAIDISSLDFSGLSLKNAQITDCLALDTDFRKSDLRDASFKKTILENAMFDGAVLLNTDFKNCEISSIYVFDEYDTNSISILKGKHARQWLYSHGAKVLPYKDLNPLLGMPWYEAAREVTITLEQRISGTHQDASLPKGTKKEFRKFAEEFTNFLISIKVLRRIKKSKTGRGYVLKVNSQNKQIIHDFSKEGKISNKLKPFFYKYLPEDVSIE
jgi:hypothetical protein